VRINLDSPLEPLIEQPVCADALQIELDSKT
jgi:hypothetical protein